MTAIEATSTELVSYQQPNLPAALTPTEAKERAQWVREVTKAALTEGTDFGVIPGTGTKPTLLKPGAEMLLLAAGLGLNVQRVIDEESLAHTGITYRATVKRGEYVVAECEGYAGYDEKRFANNRGWKADWNSVMKMAQKRAIVGATLLAVAGSGLFTQDMEDAADVHAPVFESWALIEPEFAKLNDDLKAALSAWRKEQEYPTPTTMNPEQAAATLVHIGFLQGQLAGSSFPGEGEPADTGDQNALEGAPLADVGSGEPPGTDTAAPDPMAAPVGAQAGQKFHRDLSRIIPGAKRAEHEFFVQVATLGRTGHAAEMTEQELEIATGLARSVNTGSADVATIGEEAGRLAAEWKAAHP